MANQKIEAVWLFISMDDDGDEGIPAMMGPDGVWLPLLAADRQRVDDLRPMAQEVATASGREVRLVEFTVMDEVEVLEP